MSNSCDAELLAKALVQFKSHSALAEALGVCPNTLKKYARDGLEGLPHNIYLKLLELAGFPQGAEPGLLAAVTPRKQVELEKRTFKYAYGAAFSEFKKQNAEKTVSFAAQAQVLARTADERAVALQMEAAGWDLMGYYARSGALFSRALQEADLSAPLRRKLFANSLGPLLYRGELNHVVALGRGLRKYFQKHPPTEFDKPFPWEDAPSRVSYDRMSLAMTNYFSGMAMLGLVSGTRSSIQLKVAGQMLRNAEQQLRRLAKDVPDYASYATAYADSCKARALEAEVRIDPKQAEKAVKWIEERLDSLIHVKLSRATTDVELLAWLCIAGVHIAEVVDDARQLRAFQIQAWQTADAAKNWAFYLQFFLLEHAKRVRRAGRNFRREGEGLFWHMEPEQLAVLRHVRMRFPAYEHELTELEQTSSERVARHT